VIALSRVFYSNCLIAEVLNFVLHKEPDLVVERELNCYGPSKALKIFKNSNLLASVGEIGVQLWELSTLEQKKWFEISPMFLCAAIFSDEKTVVVGRDYLHFWDIETEQSVRKVKCLPRTRMLELNEDETILAAADFGYRINLYNVESGELLRTLKSPSAFPNIKFSLNKPTLHIVREGYIYKVNIESGNHEEVYSTVNAEVNAIMEFYPGSLLIAVSHNQLLTLNQRPKELPKNELQMWDLATWQKRWSCHPKTTVSGIFEASRCMVTGGEREALNLWDSETGAQLAGYYGGNDRAFCRFEITPDRQRLIASTNAGLIMVFNLR